jgi:hypothetical protein
MVEQSTTSAAGDGDDLELDMYLEDIEDEDEHLIDSEDDDEEDSAN